MGDRIEATTTGSVQGSINFYAPMKGRPQIFAGDYARNIAKLEPHVVSIADGSASGETSDLDREGFRLVLHSTAVTNFEDKDQYDNIYKAEVRALLLELTGADHVGLIGNGAIRRSARIQGAAGDDTETPVHFAHIDASDDGIEHLLDSHLLERPEKVRRWAFFNTWRALSPPPLDEPLAVCDWRTIGAEDLMPYDSHFPDGSTFESLMLRYNPAQRWTYFSKMDENALLIFKTNDSDPEKAHFVPHTAFRDDSRSNPSPRVSVELRAYVCWLQP